MTPDTIHVFERAGLGKAPFRFVRLEKRLHVAGDTVKAGSSCDFCATSIANVCIIRDANGDEFKVGCDCVRKTGDAGLVRKISDAERKLRAKAAHSKALRVSAELDALLADDAVVAAMSAAPHSRGFSDRETGRPLTALDEVQWMVEHAGRTGRAKVLKLIKSIVGKVDA